MSAKIMVLGTYHMANPQANVWNRDVDDVLSERRQAEIKVVVEELKHFAPTKIAVEYPTGDDAMNQSYSQYLTGDYELQASEIDQIGFRLAKELGHAQLYPTDFHNEYDFEGLVQYAQEHGQGQIIEKWMSAGEEVMQATHQFEQAATVREILLHLNSPIHLRANAAGELQQIRIGQGSEYTGVDVQAKLHERNLRIFTNIVRLIEPNDRIFVLYGVGHALCLRRFVHDFGELELIEPSDYLLGGSVTKMMIDMGLVV